MFAFSAKHTRAADSTSVSRTACRLKGERLITLSTSDVAVCCSSASVSSRVRVCTALNNLAFSIAIAAWSANVVANSICLSVNGRTVLRCKLIAPIGTPFLSSGTPRSVRNPPIFWPSVYLNRHRLEHHEYARSCPRLMHGPHLCPGRSLPDDSLQIPGIRERLQTSLQSCTSCLWAAPRPTATPLDEAGPRTRLACRERLVDRKSSG